MAQTYSNAELLVVADGDDVLRTVLDAFGVKDQKAATEARADADSCELRSLDLLPATRGPSGAVRSTASKTVRSTLIHLAESRNIGEKRNFGCSRAAGEVICHWDDDDWSAPERLARQIEMLAESGKAVAGFRSMRFTDGESWWKYEGPRDYALGTSLCYRREWQQAHPFPPVHVGEDNEFTTAAWNAGQLVSEDAGELMYATIHPGNTSPRSIGSNWHFVPPWTAPRAVKA